ncbi:MAG: hypothetical protein VW715_06870 [Rhodospirillales bacterium]
MPSTYTLNNGIELIATGEQSGTWGDTTNTNFELLDTALDGQVSVTLAATGSSGSPNTLPISDGASSNGRNRLVIFGDGGDLGGTAFVQLTPNDAEKIIYVRNNLAGSRSILLFQGTYSASNDYEVPAGTTAVVFFNGAGTGAVAANVFNNAFFDSLRLGGVSVDKILDEDNMASNDAAALATQQSIKAYVDTQVGANNELSEVLANGNTTGGTDIAVSTGDDITFADSSKAIFGAGSDLQIYHDGSNSYIDEQGTGDLRIRGGNDIQIRTPDDENYIVCNQNDSVQLFFDASEKLATESGGVNITGTLTSDGLTVDGNTTFNSTVTIGSGSYFISNATNGFRFNNSGDTAQLLYIKDTGEAVFNENGINYDFRVESDSSTHMLFVDAGNNRVGINAGSTPSSIFHILNNDTVNSILQDTSANGEAYHSYINDVNQWRTGVFNDDTYRVYDLTNSESRIQIYAGAEMVINEGGADRDFRVESDSSAHMIFVDAGNNRVGINKSAPERVFHVGGESEFDGTIFIDKADGTAVQVIGTSNNTGYINWESNGWTLFTNGPREILRIDSSEMVVNQDSHDIDFRVESNNATHMLYVDSTNDRIGINTNTPEHMLNLVGAGDVGIHIQADSNNVGENDNPYISFSQDGSSTQQLKIGLVGEADQEFTGSLANASFIHASNNFDQPLQLAQDGQEVATLYKTVAIFNERSGDQDFRVESDSNANAIFMNAGNGTTAFGSNTDYYNSSTNEGIYLNPGNSSSFSANSPVLRLNRMGTGGNDRSTLEFYNNGTIRSFFGAFGTTDGMYMGTGNGASKNLNMYSTSVVLNEDSADIDFRVESDNNANMFVVDAGEDVVGIRDADTTLLGSLVSRGEATYSGGNVAGLFYANSGNRGTIRIRSVGDNSAECAFDVNGGIRWMISTRGSGDPQGAHCMKWYPAHGTPQLGAVGGYVMALTQSGNLTVGGSLSKGSGSFRIKHPLPEKNETHDLVHSFVEAPQADNLYRGKATLVAGQATVNIDTMAGMTEGTFVLLNREVQCFTSNETGWTAVRGSVSGNILTIEAQDNTCTDTISWMVVGERQDEHMYDTDWTDENGKVIVEPLRPAGSDDPS